MAGRSASERLFYDRASRRSNSYRILLLLFLIAIATWTARSVFSGQVTSPFSPTPTPTRSPTSYILQAEAYFQAGKLDDPNSENDAIDTYRRVLEVDSQNARVMAELARILTYSTRILITDQERLARLEEARDLVYRAIEITPDDSTILALAAFVLDWNASSNLISASQREAYLAEAEQHANRSYLLDPQNALGLAFYAEVLLDQNKWDQALEYAEQATLLSPDSMDAHRVYGTVLESIGSYNAAISEYQAASDLAPNLTFLPLQIGIVYRNLGNRIEDVSAAKPLYDAALDYFDRAATINEQLGIKDPLPYIAIAKAYAQQGQFFVASRNAEKALSYSPAAADTYGQLGMIYVQARNYESALPALKCAVEGCTAAENLIAQDFVDQLILTQSVAVAPLELTNLTVAYYYIRYGSVLAFLSEPTNDYCERTIRLMGVIREKFPSDEVLLQNAAENETLCRTLLDSYGK
jgi:tetratricopeptide (TPR) repeat protein